MSTTTAAICLLTNTLDFAVFGYHPNGEKAMQAVSDNSEDLFGFFAYKVNCEVWSNCTGMLRSLQFVCDQINEPIQACSNLLVEQDALFKEAYCKAISLGESGPDVIDYLYMVLLSLLIMITLCALCAVYAFFARCCCEGLEQRQQPAVHVFR